jgi:hypothetical protein
MKNVCFSVTYISPLFTSMIFFPGKPEGLELLQPRVANPGYREKIPFHPGGVTPCTH